jgi:hypothetical protein
MKHKSILTLLLMGFSVSYAHEEDCLASFEKFQIRTKAQKSDPERYSSSEDTSSNISAEDIISTLDLLKPKTCHGVCLASQAIDDEVFSEIAESLKVRESFPDDSVLDVSYNCLTDGSIDSILNLLMENKFKFVVLYGNKKISSRNFLSFCKALKTICDAGDGDQEKVRDITSRICFLPRHYIWQAQHKVRIYNQLAELGYLDPNWPEKQKIIHRTLAKHQRRQDISFPQLSMDEDLESKLSVREDLTFAIES